MGAASGGRNKVYVGLCNLRGAVNYPLKYVVGGFLNPLSRMLNGHFRHALGVAYALFKILFQTVLIIPADVVFRLAFNRQAHAQTGAEYRLGAQQMAQPRHRQRGGIKVSSFRNKSNAGTRIALTHRIDFF